MGKLDGQVVLVTGAGKGIGKAIVELFAAEGALIGACGRNMASLDAVCSDVVSAGGKAVPIKLELQSAESIEAAAAECVAELGPIDILINNAGIIALDKLNDTSAEVWDEIMSTNVRGPFLMCKAVVPSMMERHTGRIINVGSMAGRRGYPEQGAYCASKHALVGYSKVLALETQKFGIRVHMLSPGGVLTELSRDLREFRGETEDSPEWMTAQECAEAAMYLCTQTGAAFTDELVLRRFASEPWR
jgi:3-oxoacyl-[acyl-carrier protein] reductase